MKKLRESGHLWSQIQHQSITNDSMLVLSIKRAATTTANIIAHIHNLSELGTHWTVLEISRFNF